MTGKLSRCADSGDLEDNDIERGSEPLHARARAREMCQLCLLSLATIGDLSRCCFVQFDGGADLLQSRRQRYYLGPHGMKATEAIPSAAHGVTPSAFGIDTI